MIKHTVEFDPESGTWIVRKGNLFLAWFSFEADAHFVREVFDAKQELPASLSLCGTSMIMGKIVNLSPPHFAIEADGNFPP
jgi:hypothetical protein